MNSNVTIVPPPPARQAFLEHRKRRAAIAQELEPLNAQHAAASQAIAKASAPDGELAQLQTQRKATLGEKFLGRILGQSAKSLQDIERQITEKQKFAAAALDHAEGATAATELLAPQIQAIHARYVAEAGQATELQRAMFREQLLAIVPLYEREAAKYTTACIELTALCIACDMPLPSGNFSVTAVGMPAFLSLPVPVNVKAFEDIGKGRDIGAAAYRRAGEMLAEFQQR
jgi:hypothetical protein